MRKTAILVVVFLLFVVHTYSQTKQNLKGSSMKQTETDHYTSLQESVKPGKLVYEGNCISCHMQNGEGLQGAVPPLAKTGRLTDKKRLVRIIYNGLEGPITVIGKSILTK